MSCCYSNASSLNSNKCPHTTSRMWNDNWQKYFPSSGSRFRNVWSSPTRWSSCLLLRHPCGTQVRLWLSKFFSHSLAWVSVSFLVLTIHHLLLSHWVPVKIRARGNEKQQEEREGSVRINSFVELPTVGERLPPFSGTHSYRAFFVSGFHRKTEAQASAGLYVCGAVLVRPCYVNERWPPPPASGCYSGSIAELLTLNK